MTTYLRQASARLEVAVRDEDPLRSLGALEHARRRAAVGLPGARP